MYVEKRPWVSQWLKCPPVYVNGGLVVFQDLKANESRLRDINKVASELESEGLMAEEVPMVQSQVAKKECEMCQSSGWEMLSLLHEILNAKKFASSI